MKNLKEQIDGAGKPIPLDVAEKYVNEYRKIKEKLEKKIFSKLTDVETTQPEFEISEAFKHFSSKANAFIFSKEMVTRFFEKTHDNPKPAEYLMVLFAAKFEGPDKSNPTVVLAGVNEAESYGDFVSLNIKDPGTEQPPFKVNCSFPPKNGSKQLVITLE